MERCCFICWLWRSWRSWAFGLFDWNLCRMNTDPGVHTLEFSVAQLPSSWQVRPSLDLDYLIWEDTTSCFYIFWPVGMWKENKLRKKMVKAVHKVKKYSSNSIFKWGNIQICKFDYLKQFNGISYIHDADCSILKAEHSLGEHFILLILRK